MNFAVWNVRGLNKKPHQDEVVNFINANHLSLCALVETKVKLSNSMLVAKKIKKGWNWLFNYGDHYNGRVWVGWDPNFWNISMLHSSPQDITCLCEFKEKQISFVATFVYAFNDGNDRVALWDFLTSFVTSLPWTVLGDFNCVLSMDEISGGREHWTPDMQQFKDCVFDANLVTLSTVGAHFTWRNNRTALVTKRLDRVLISQLWNQAHPAAYVTVLNRGLMDHSPLMVTVPMSLDRAKKCFQFFNYMMDLEGFNDAVLKAWREPFFGDPMSLLCKRLKILRQLLVSMNKNHGLVGGNTAKARDDLASIQAQLRSNPLDPLLAVQEMDAIGRLNSALLIEEGFYLQKSRVKWLSLGDSNHSFFFNQTKNNWNCNKVLSLRDDSGVLVKGHSEVARVAVSYFQNSLGVSPTPRECVLPELDYGGLSDVQQRTLVAPVNDALILCTLKSFKKNKAPGPDGFNVEFFLRCWDIVGPLFCDAVRDFFERSVMHPGVNSTLIALIPKSSTAASMKDFRPISLCTVAYKCVSKILASRIKNVLPSLIHISQSAFIPGRQISDNILLAQELFRGYTRDTGIPKCALKIDLHKAFDSISWDFVLAALTRLNFPRIFVNWVAACISTTRFSVKVNGASCGYFCGAKGIRQGDPLSPYLFTVAMHIFSTMLSKVPSDFQFHWRCKQTKLNHLLFADDVLLFARGDKSSIEHLMDCLARFGALSGLNASHLKSTVFFCNCDPEVTSWFDEQFGMPHGSLPVRFLGVPLISSKLSINDCMPLVEKILAKIATWTVLLLSYAGRLKLIEVILLSIQNFWARHFVLPKGVHKHIQQLLTRFLWKGNVETVGGAKVSWADICLPKSEGGLGLKKPVEWNTALILMHLWSVCTGKQSLWANWVRLSVLKGKNFWGVPIPTDCSWIWRKILTLRELARCHIKFKIGNGRNISLWFDPWWQHTSLAKGLFDPIIRAAGSNPGATLSDLMGSGRWVLPQGNGRLHHPHPRLLAWQQQFVSPPFDLSSSDSIFWDDIPDSKLKAKDIWESIRVRVHCFDWAEGVWCKLKIPRFCFHSWLLCHDRVCTRARSKFWGPSEDDSCIFCVNGVESSQHLFVSCPYARFVHDLYIGGVHHILWDYSLSWSDLVVQVLRITDVAQREVILLYLQTFAYHMWRERNARLHGGGSFHPAKLLTGILVDIRSRASSSRWLARLIYRRPIICTWLV